jgi:molecular chaperone GrpE (heat shock protein)
MKRDRLNSELQVLERKIRLLIAQYDKEKRKSADFQSKYQELKDLVESKEQQIRDFQNKNNISTIVDSIAVGDEAAEVKNKIDDYIKEIDRCINQLNK